MNSSNVCIGIGSIGVGVYSIFRATKAETQRERASYYLLAASMFLGGAAVLISDEQPGGRGGRGDKDAAPIAPEPAPGGMAERLKDIVEESIADPLAELIVPDDVSSIEADAEAFSHV